MAFIETLHRLFMEASMGLTVEETCVAYKLIDKMLVLYRKHEEIPAKDVDIPPMEVNSDKKNNLGSLWNNVGSTFIWPKTSGEPSLKLPSSSTKEVRNSQMLTDDDKESSTVTEEVGTPMELCDTEKTLSPVLEQHVRIVVPVLEEGEIPPTSPSASEEDIIIISSSISSTPSTRSIPNAPQKNQSTYQEKMVAALKRSEERAKVKTMEVYFANKTVKKHFTRANPGYMKWETFTWMGEPNKNVVCDSTKEAVDVMKVGGNAFFCGPPKQCPKNAFKTDDTVKMKRRIEAIALHLAGKRLLPRCKTEIITKKKTPTAMTATTKTTTTAATTPIVLRRSKRVRPTRESVQFWSAPQPGDRLEQPRSSNGLPWNSVAFDPLFNRAIAPLRSQMVPERPVQSLSVPPKSLTVPPKLVSAPPKSLSVPPKSLPLNQSLSVFQSLPGPSKSLAVPTPTLSVTPKLVSVPPKSLPVPTPPSNVSTISLPPPTVTKTVKQEVPSFSVPDVKFNITYVSSPFPHFLPLKDQPLTPTVDPTPKKTVKQEVVDPIPDNSVPNPTPSSNVKKEVNTQ